MRTKRFLLTNIVAIFVVAIIGAGFSLWFFGNYTISTDKNNLGKDVTQLIEVGTFDMNTIKDFRFNFDQSETGRTTNASGVVLGDATPTGITLEFGENTKEVVYNVPTGDGVTDNIEDTLVRTFTVTVTVTNALAQYFDLNLVGADGWTRTKAADAANTTYTFSSTTQTSFDWGKVSATYYIADVAGNETTLAQKREPANKEEYAAFRSVVLSSANTINVSYKVEVSAAD